jgi:hypothetical protein
MALPIFGGVFLIPIESNARREWVFRTHEVYISHIYANGKPFGPRLMLLRPCPQQFDVAAELAG